MPTEASRKPDDGACRMRGLLEQCAIHLTERARTGDLQPAYFRDAEVEQILTSLASPLKGQIVVTGAARVGKTAVIHTAAERIYRGDCPAAIEGSEVWSLSARSILRAFGVLGWQEKLGQLMSLWGSHPEVILYIDALPSTLAAGATMDDPFDMAQFLLGQLQSSDNRLITEGRSDAVAGFLSAYPEFKHILMEVKVTEPDIQTVQDIVHASAEDIHRKEGVRIRPEASEHAIDLTRRFALAEALPGKAIDLLLEALALLTAEPSDALVLAVEDVIARFAEKTGLPRILLTDDEPYDEAEVRSWFGHHVLGQEPAVDTVVQTLSLLRTRLNDPRRPMGVFLFIGPTGVGKTELARALSTFFFGSEDLIVRFNMADYVQDWHVGTLFGNPHGFDEEARRGQFTMRLQDKAFSVILLDEFEKAHPEVFLRFFQLFDEGMLINGTSEVVNLRNAIFILTSNFGARILSAPRLGFGPSVSLEDHEHQIREELVRFFSPELVNRIDSISFFKPLTPSVLREIAYRRVQEILQREGIQRRGLEVEIENSVIEWVVQHGYSERYGARYLSRQIEKAIAYPLAQQLIRNQPPDGASLRLFMREGRIASALELPDLSSDGVSPDMEDALSAAELRALLPALRREVDSLLAQFDLADMREQLSERMRLLSSISVWDDLDTAQVEISEVTTLSNRVEQLERLQRNFEAFQNVLGRGGGRGTHRSDAMLKYTFIVHEMGRIRLAEKLGEISPHINARLSVTPVGKRSEAAHWAAQLMQMYRAWAEDQPYLVRDVTDQDSILVSGYGAYGLLRLEDGIHRLTRRTDEGKTQHIRALVRVLPDPLRGEPQVGEQPEMVRAYYPGEDAVHDPILDNAPAYSAFMAGNLSDILSTRIES